MYVCMYVCVYTCLGSNEESQSQSSNAALPVFVSKRQQRHSGGLYLLYISMFCGCMYVSRTCC